MEQTQATIDGITYVISYVEDMKYKAVHCDLIEKGKKKVVFTTTIYAKDLRPVTNKRNLADRIIEEIAYRLRRKTNGLGSKNKKSR